MFRCFTFNLLRNFKHKWLKCVILFQIHDTWIVFRKTKNEKKPTSNSLDQAIWVVFTIFVCQFVLTGELYGECVYHEMRQSVWLSMRTSLCDSIDIVHIHSVWCWRLQWNIVPFTRKKERAEIWDVHIYSTSRRAFHRDVDNSNNSSSSRATAHIQIEKRTQTNTPNKHARIPPQTHTLQILLRRSVRCTRMPKRKCVCMHVRYPFRYRCLPTRIQHICMAFTKPNSQYIHTNTRFAHTAMLQFGGCMRTKFEIYGKTILKVSLTWN